VNGVEPFAALVHRRHGKIVEARQQVDVVGPRRGADEWGDSDCGGGPGSITADGAELVAPGQVVGIGDGAFVSATADAMVDAGTPVSATIVPLCGGYWFTGPGREPFRRIADALRSSVHGLMAPGVVDDPATKASLYAHAGIRAVMALWERLDIALFGIGSPAWGESSFGPDIFRQLAASGAVGEVLIAPFDLDGHFGADDLRARTIAFDARDLVRVPMTIGVAGGPSKVRPILGALRAGVVKVLVTDVRTAEAVIDLEAETSPSGTTRRVKSAAAPLAR